MRAEARVAVKAFNSSDKKKKGSNIAPEEEQPVQREG